jgi:hypothetical protein
MEKHRGEQRQKKTDHARRSHRIPSTDWRRGRASGSNADVAISLDSPLKAQLKVAYSFASRRSSSVSIVRAWPRTT